MAGPLRERLLGADADDLGPLTRAVAGAVARNHGAKAAVDVALHDLVARRRGVSLPVLLGSTTHRVPADVTLAAGTVDDLAAAAAARGRRRLLGAQAQGRHRRRLRRRPGPRRAGRSARTWRSGSTPTRGWTPREAVRVIGALEDAHTDVELVEQPVRAEDLDGLAWVTARVGTPVMADEAVYGVRDLVEVIHRRAATWSTSSSRSAAVSGRPLPCSSSPARTTWAPSSAR